MRKIIEYPLELRQCIRKLTLHVIGLSKPVLCIVCKRAVRKSLQETLKRHCRIGVLARLNKIKGRVVVVLVAANRYRRRRNGLIDVGYLLLRLLDLTDGLVDGGELDVYSIGANWWLSPSWYLAFDLRRIENERGGLTGWSTGALTRLVLILN